MQNFVQKKSAAAAAAANDGSLAPDRWQQPRKTAHVASRGSKSMADLRRRNGEDGRQASARGQSCFDASSYTESSEGEASNLAKTTHLATSWFADARNGSPDDTGKVVNQSMNVNGLEALDTDRTSWHVRSGAGVFAGTVHSYPETTTGINSDDNLDENLPDGQDRGLIVLPFKVPAVSAQAPSKPQSNTKYSLPRKVSGEDVSLGQEPQPSSYHSPASKSLKTQAPPLQNPQYLQTPWTRGRTLQRGGTVSEWLSQHDQNNLDMNAPQTDRETLSMRSIDADSASVLARDQMLYHQQSPTPATQRDPGSSDRHILLDHHTKNAANDQEDSRAGPPAAHDDGDDSDEPLSNRASEMEDDRVREHAASEDHVDIDGPRDDNDEDDSDHDSMDYSPEELKNLDAATLRNEPFDRSSSKDWPDQADTSDTNSLSRQLAHALATNDPEQQKTLLSSLSMAEWEQAGEWFTEQFADVNRKLRKSRQERRKMAKAIEEKVWHRYDEVVDGQKAVDESLANMRKSGSALLAQAPPKRPFSQV